MNILFTLIFGIYLGVVAVLTVIGEKILSYICKKSKKVRSWFDNLPMNKEC